MDQTLLLWLGDLLWWLLFWTVAVFLLVAGLYMIVGPALRQGRAERRVAKALRQAGLTSLNNLVLKGRRGGLCQVDHVVRLPTGIVVLETCMRTGRLTGHPRAGVWRQTLGVETYRFGNPLHRLHRAMAAVRGALADAKLEPPLVTGQVLVPGRTQFARSRPDGVSPLAPFLQDLRAAQANGDSPDPEIERVWAALRKAGLVHTPDEGRAWHAPLWRALRHLMADPRTAAGVIFTGAGALMLTLLLSAGRPS